MIKSRFKPYGFGLTLIMTLIMTFLFISGCSEKFFDIQIIELKMPLTFSSIGLLYFGSPMWRETNIIKVDPIAQTIIFKNLITRRSKLYQFSYFDGFIDMYQNSKSGNYRAVYFVKDKRYVEKISSFYYSNLDDLQSAFKPIKYLGFKYFSFSNSLKVFIGEEIQD